MATRPTTVLLVRHGATASTGKVLPGRARGLHLARRGHDQAAALAERLSALSPAPSAIYSSPLERTRETARALERALGLRAKTDRGLTECDFGDWTGSRLSQLRKKPEWSMIQNAPSSFQFPNGESFTEMQQRVWSTLARLASQHPGQSIVAVSHADPIKAAITYAQGVPLDLFQRTVISTCSVSALVLGAGRPIVLCVNSLGALNELVVS